MKVKSESEVVQLCPTLRDHGKVHGIFEARVLEWGAIAFSAVFPEVVSIAESYLTTSVANISLPCRQDGRAERV